MAGDTPNLSKVPPEAVKMAPTAIKDIRHYSVGHETAPPVDPGAVDSPSHQGQRAETIKVRGHISHTLYHGLTRKMTRVA